ncbi:MAG: hypothetical protein ABL889_01915 [Terricaulis sp.]
MFVDLKGFALDDYGRALVQKTLSAGHDDNWSAKAVLSHVLNAGGVYAVLEEPYNDQDYATDYVNFYASAFRNYPKHTKRLHFFAQDVSDVFEKPISEQHDLLAKSHYLGNVVIRPIAQGPIGRTTLAFPTYDAPLIARPAARANFSSHLLGADLEMRGVAPFIQQDSKLSSCAQAAIWMASRPVHQRHRRTSWHSVAEITRLATTPTDAALSRALPAGSGGLDPIHIIRALRAMGHQPLFDYFVSDTVGGCAKCGAGAQCQCAPAPTAAKAPAPSSKAIANTAAEVLVRYLDSGVPVIVALADVGEDVGHAVTAVGFVEDANLTGQSSTSYAGFVRALIVHDDQRGPYRLMPLRESDIATLPADQVLRNPKDTPLTVQHAATHMFVPLPERVLMRAERADTVARDFLRKYVTQLSDKMLEKLFVKQPDQASIAAPAMSHFNDLVRSDKLISRTYLTQAGRYRHHLSRSNLDDMVKAELTVRELPHFVWVTELIEPGATPKNGGARPIIGHMVTSAASSTDPDSDLLMAHLPHFLIHRDVNSEHWGDDFVEEATFFPVHLPYDGRQRS